MNNHPIHNYQNFTQQQLMQQTKSIPRKIKHNFRKHSNVQNTFQNTRYQFNRRDRKTLLSLHQVIGTDTTFSTTLVEPLIIDKLSGYLFGTFYNTDTDIIMKMLDMVMIVLLY